VYSLVARRYHPRDAADGAAGAPASHHA
jgi:hypothetical protein